MGCPRHLEGSRVKEESVAAESVEPSQRISPRRGLKGRGAAAFRLLLPQTFSLLGLFLRMFFFCAGFFLDRNDVVWMKLNGMIFVFFFFIF